LVGEKYFIEELGTYVVFLLFFITFIFLHFKIAKVFS
jgi:hypothetical protein